MNFKLKNQIIEKNYKCSFQIMFAISFSLLDIFIQKNKQKLINIKRYSVIFKQYIKLK